MTSFASGCSDWSDDEPALVSGRSRVPNVPVPPANGPKLGALAELTPILSRPERGAPPLGYLKAGAQVARAKRPFSDDGCAGGWYPVRPRGFVCAGTIASLDLKHPTLQAMALMPDLEQTLPFAYARTRKETPLYEQHPEKDGAVREIGKLRAGSSLAVVGSWSALDPDGTKQRFGLMTNGKFVAAGDLLAAEPSDFKGVELGERATLPVGFVVKRGIRSWHIERREPERFAELDVHASLPLTGKHRDVAGVRYLALEGGKYVRARDITVVRERSKLPELADGKQKWIDVSVQNGTLVLYEGKRPVFATLISVSKDKGAATPLGTYRALAKHVTLATHDPEKITDDHAAYDLAWTLELEHGVLMHAAPWHDHFGVEHGLGTIQLSPSDARHIWRWAEPDLPERWHTVMAAGEESTTVVVVRK